MDKWAVLVRYENDIAVYVSYDLLDPSGYAYLETSYDFCESEAHAAKVFLGKIASDPNIGYGEGQYDRARWITSLPG